MMKVCLLNSLSVVGVANIGKHLANMTHQPSWITHNPGGHGFAELAAKLLNK